MGCQQSKNVQVVMRPSQETRLRVSLNQLLLHSSKQDLQGQNHTGSSSSHRDVFSIFAEHGMTLEPVGAVESSNCSPFSPAGSVFSTATTASDTERTHIHGPVDQYIAPLNVSYGAYSDKGVRKQNEDRQVCAAQEIHNGDMVAYFGIYDGHGGSHVAEYLCENLHVSLFDRLNSNSRSDMSSCIENTFAATDEQIFTKQIESGSTAISVLLRGSRAVIASVGDSQAVLSTRGQAMDLCDIHTPHMPEERERILAAKGNITKGRIYGLLGVSRAFGDNDFKTGKGEFKSKFNGDLVIATPHIVEREISAEDEFIVLGCDGLFDVMAPQDVVNFVRKKLALHGEVQHACEELVSYAISIGSTDNVSAIIVCFNPDDPTTAIPDQNNRNEEDAQPAEL